MDILYEAAVGRCGFHTGGAFEQTEDQSLLILQVGYCVVVFPQAGKVKGLLQQRSGRIYIGNGNAELVQLHVARLWLLPPKHRASEIAPCKTPDQITSMFATEGVSTAMMCSAYLRLTAPTYSCSRISGCEGIHDFICKCPICIAPYIA